MGLCRQSYFYFTTVFKLPDFPAINRPAVFLAVFFMVIR